MNDKTLFFVLEEPSAGTAEDKVGGTRAMPEEGFNVGEAPRCPRCGRFIGSLAWLPPYRVEIETWGREFGDLVIASGRSMLASDRFRQIYERSGLKGLSGFEPVEIVKITRHRKLRGDPPKYFKVNVARSQTTEDQTASGVEWSEEATSFCPECLFPKEGVVKRWKKVAIRPETWQGEDIFIPRGGGGIITSRRFKEACEANKIRNVLFVSAEKHAHDFYPWEKQT